MDTQRESRTGSSGLPTGPLQIGGGDFLELAILFLILAIVTFLL